MDAVTARASSHATAAEGWDLTRLTPPSRLYGANGIRTGADGRIYVAQVVGSQVSAINPDTGEIETISPFGGDIVGPDDLAFDDDNNLYVTEITESRVSVRAPNGTVRILQGDIPAANPITFHQGRLIVGECREGARIMELDRNGGAPRIILENVPMANAFEVGPDGLLYFPVMAANQIWRVNLAGGEPEIVAAGLGVPDSVKFDSQGFIVSTQVGSGEVLRINPRNGDRTVLADIGPGLDNCTFVGDRLFVSHVTGSIHEIVAPGTTRQLVDRGFLFPMGIAAAPNGTIFVADGICCYALTAGGPLELQGMMFTPGFPGVMRGAATSGRRGEWIITTSSGSVHRYLPAEHHSEEIASGFDLLMGVAVAPDGAMIVAESGTGRLLSIKDSIVEQLASSLATPTGVAIGDNGECFVAEKDSGRVVRVASSGVETIVDGLAGPEGLAYHAGRLFVVDVPARQIISCRQDGGDRQTIASNLPIGAPVGTVRNYLRGVGAMAGPLLPFSGLAIAPDGAVIFSADAEGSIMALQQL